MANVDAPFGLRPVRHKNGNPFNGAMSRYAITNDSLTYGIFVGDAVVKHADGATAAGIPLVTEVTVGDANLITGIVVGFEPDPDNLSLNYRATGTTTTERIVYVVDDPDVVFEIQDDGAALLDLTDIVGLNAVLIRNVAGASNGYRSGLCLDTNSDVPAADASNQLLVLGPSKKIGNTVGEVNCVWEVLVNMHSLRTPALGV